MHAGIDLPDERKVHAVPIPRIGGIAIALGTIFPILLWAPMDEIVKGFLAGAAVIVLFGLIDDVWGLNYRIKFAGQVTAAAVAIVIGSVQIHSLGTLLPEGVQLGGWFAFFITIIAIVGVTNAINLADGLDGLAGGISLLGFCTIGYLSFIEQDVNITIVCVAMAGAIFGFLRFNTYPASLFMGDTGSQLLGFGAIYLSLALTQGDTALSPILPLIILGFPILDTLTVMVERMMEGRSPFSADKNHFHHRLISLGLFHTEAVFLIYIIQAALIVIAYFLRFYSDWLLLTGYFVFSAVIISLFHWADAKNWKFRRYDFIDRVIKGRLKELRDKGLLIQAAFRTVEAGIPLLLITACFMTGTVPYQLSIFSLVLLGIMLAVWYFKKDRLEQAIMAALYPMIPFVIYLVEYDKYSWVSSNVMRVYNLAFVVLAVFVFLTMKLTKRKKGFHTTPMDFLILFMVLAAPTLIGLNLGGVKIGFISAKIVMLFFSFEVLIGELRGRVRLLALWTVLALVIIGVRGITL